MVGGLVIGVKDQDPMIGDIAFFGSSKDSGQHMRLADNIPGMGCVYMVVQFETSICWVRTSETCPNANYGHV